MHIHFTNIQMCISWTYEKFERQQITESHGLPFDSSPPALRGIHSFYDPIVNHSDVIILFTISAHPERYDKKQIQTFQKILHKSKTYEWILPAM